MSANETHYVANSDHRRVTGVRAQDAGVTVRWETIPGRQTDDEGQRAVDEILTSQVHLEMMDDANCWMDVNGLRVWLRAFIPRGRKTPRLVITATPDSCHEVTRQAERSGRGGR